MGEIAYSRPGKKVIPSPEQASGEVWWVRKGEIHSYPSKNTHNFSFLRPPRSVTFLGGGQSFPGALLALQARSHESVAEHSWIAFFEGVPLTDGRKKEI